MNVKIVFYGYFQLLFLTKEVCQLSLIIDLKRMLSLGKSFFYINNKTYMVLYKYRYTQYLYDCSYNTYRKSYKYQSIQTYKPQQIFYICIIDENTSKLTAPITLMVRNPKLIWIYQAFNNLFGFIFCQIDTHTSLNTFIRFRFSGYTFLKG